MEEKRINKSNILWHEHIKMEGQIQEDRAMKEKHFYIILPNGKKKKFQWEKIMTIRQKTITSML